MHGYSVGENQAVEMIYGLTQKLLIAKYIPVNYLFFIIKKIEYLIWFVWLVGNN